MISPINVSLETAWICQINTKLRETVNEGNLTCGQLDWGCKIDH
jgi:hypothetical protein